MNSLIISTRNSKVQKFKEAFKVAFPHTIPMLTSVPIFSLFIFGRTNFLIHAMMGLLVVFCLRVFQ